MNRLTVWCGFINILLTSFDKFYVQGKNHWILIIKSCIHPSSIYPSLQTHIFWTVGGDQGSPTVQELSPEPSPPCFPPTTQLSWQKQHMFLMFSGLLNHLSCRTMRNSTYPHGRHETMRLICLTAEITLSPSAFRQGAPPGQTLEPLAAFCSSTSPCDTLANSDSG